MLPVLLSVSVQRTLVLCTDAEADMTALMDEIEAAIAEGAEILELHAPQAIETNKKGQVTAMVADPKIIGLITGGRPFSGKFRKRTNTYPLVTSLLLLSDKILFLNH